MEAGITRRVTFRTLSTPMASSPHPVAQREEAIAVGHQEEAGYGSGISLPPAATHRSNTFHLDGDGRAPSSLDSLEEEKEGKEEKELMWGRFPCPRLLNMSSLPSTSASSATSSSAAHDVVNSEGDHGGDGMAHTSGQGSLRQGHSAEVCDGGDGSRPKRGRLLWEGAAFELGGNVVDLSSELLFSFRAWNDHLPNFCGRPFGCGTLDED